MNNSVFCKAYGLNIRSDFVIPELPQGGTGRDLYIQKDKIVLPPTVNFASVHYQGTNMLFAGDAELVYLQWPGKLTLQAEQGSRLIVNSEIDDMESGLLNLFILGEGLGLVLYQKGFFLLHASAVKVGEQAIVFIGSSGVGKSTTAAAFAEAGHIVISDDLVALDLDGTNEIMVLPSFPAIKLWPSAVKGLGYDPSLLRRLYSSTEKQLLRQGQDFPEAPIPLACIYILEEASTLKITRLTGTGAFLPYVHYCRCPSSYLRGMTLGRHFRQSMKLLSKIPIRKLQRPMNYSVLKKLVDEFEREYL